MNYNIESEYLDTPQLATMLNVSVKAIIKWREECRIPGAIKFGRVWRFNKREIQKRLLSGNFLLDNTDSLPNR